MKAAWSTLLKIIAVVLWPARKIDGFLQSLVNDCVFFLVRRGVQKSTVRYTIGVILVLALAVGSFVDFRMGLSHGELVADAFTVALLFTCQQANRHFDQMVENGRMPWKPRSQFVWRLWGYEMLVSYVLQFEGVLAPRKAILARPDLRPFYFFAWITFEAAWLLALFIEETPPNPPEPAPRQVLVPIRSST